MEAKKDEHLDEMDLAMVEEIFRRYNARLAVDLHAPLPKKSNDSRVLARLAKLEQNIIRRAKNRGI